MRIGIDGRAAFLGRGGIAVYVRRLTEALARTEPQDEVRVYGYRFRRAGAGTGFPALPPNARVLGWPIPSRGAEVLARLGFGADRLLGGCDVLHATDYLLLRPTRAPLVATVHDVLFAEMPRCYTPGMRRGLHAATRALVRRAARIVVPSVRTKIALVERFAADPGRVDVTPLAPRPLPDVPAAAAARPYVLAVGTLEPRKNVARLLEAHRRARAAGLDADLVVAGARGWMDDDLVRALSTTPGVRWEGAVDDARLSALFQGALALAYPSLGEGFGLPVAEALSLGVPVLSSAGTACADLAGDAALLVDPYDADAIADGLVRLATDDGLRAALAARGRARAAAWTWEATARATRVAYARAAA